MAKMSHMFFAVILAVVAVLAVVWVVGGQGFSVAGTQTDPTTGLKLDSSVDCQDPPTVSPTIVDALNMGTSVSANMVARLNNQFKGAITSSTEFQRGDNVQVLFGASNYLNQTTDEITMECGPNDVRAEMFATSTNTFRVFNTNGQAVTDNVAGGVTNQSSSAAPISMEVKLDSTSDQSTGDLIVVIEHVNSSAVDKIELTGSGVSSATTPDFYTLNNAASKVEAFSVPALLDGAVGIYTLRFTPKSGKTIGGDAAGDGVYITAYSTQDFPDTDGTFQSGIENKNGVLKYEDTYDFDFLIRG